MSDIPLKNDELRELFLKIICSPNAPSDYPGIPDIRPMLQRTIEEMTDDNSPCRVKSTICDKNSARKKARRKAENAAKAALVRRINTNGNNYDTNLIEACWDFVDYQINSRDICMGSTKTFLQEGFQIGSPWHGDVEEAPVLFLSINPAITHRCFFPRWHVHGDVFTLAGLDDSGSSNYNITDINGTTISNCVDDGKIYSFLTNRFQETPLTPDAGNLDAVVVDGYHRCIPRGYEVKYWRGMKDVMTCLLGDGFTDTRRLMRSVLSAEIIFWGTKRENNVNNSLNRLQYFWNAFVSPLLRNCGAEILFLVGATSTLKVFNKITNNALENGDAMSWAFGGKNFHVAAINNPGRSKPNYKKAVDALNDNCNITATVAKAKDMYQE